jgi:hypothetical protein
VKLVHLLGFIIKKFVTIHDHKNVKFLTTSPVVNSSKETIQWIPCILCYTKFHCCMYNNLPLVSIINDVTPFQDFLLNLSSILTSCCYVILCIQRRCLPSIIFLTQLLCCFSFLPWHLETIRRKLSLIWMYSADITKYAEMFNYRETIPWNRH